MELKNLLNILGKITKILKIYENKDVSFEQILDDIYEKIKIDYNECKSNINNNESIDINHVLNQIINLDKIERIELLSRYKKVDLLKIAHEIGIKSSKGLKSEALVETISNYYSFANLSQDMATRDLNPSNFFDEEVNSTTEPKNL